MAAPAGKSRLFLHELVQRDLEGLRELLERLHLGIPIHARFQLGQRAIGDSRLTGQLILRQPDLRPVALDVVSQHNVLALLTL